MPQPDDEIDDAELMLRTARGNTEAFQQLVERHQALVLGTVARMLGYNSDIEDVAQQVFIRVWRSASRYTPTAKFTTWLLTITRNLVFNESRRRKRHPAVALDAPEAGETLSLPDPSRSIPDEALLERELEAAIDQAILSLPEKQRLAVVLRRFENKSYEEIADVLNLSVPAVKSVLFRARSELRALLRRYLDR